MRNKIIYKMSAKGNFMNLDEASLKIITYLLVAGFILFLSLFVFYIIRHGVPP